MERKNFGQLNNGTSCFLYTIENEYLKVAVTDYGATLISLIVKEKNRDVVLGFDSVNGYEQGTAYVGATVGRVCNRIEKGQFVINNKTVQLFVNNNGNTLHGGEVGFSHQLFAVTQTANEIVLKRVSDDLEDGFPGKLDIKIIYRLVDHQLEYCVQATAYEDTICSITNHAYFNLNGYKSGSILDHEVQIESDKIGIINFDGLTLEQTMDVKNSPFDFTKFKRVGKDIDKDHIQIHNGFGYDHNYILKEDMLNLATTVKTDDLSMQIKTTLPCMHFYTANFLDETLLGKEGSILKRRTGLCFETQYYPNAINYTSHRLPIVKAHQTQSHTTYYIFKMIERDKL